MVNRVLLIVLLFFGISSCSDDGNEPVLETLQDYINANSDLISDEVIACAASKKEDVSTSFIFYYPIPNATDIRYFETINVNENENDFSLYKERELSKEEIFNGYLERFIRKDSKEVWCIVTYKTAEKFHKSNPIRLKNKSTPTEWTDNVTIDTTKSLQPKFSWDDGVVKDNAIYFQVITDENNNFISGTYTYDMWFEYYTLSNVVLNITRETPPMLKLKSEYNFTLMGVSEDNWVNLVIEKPFVAK